MRGLCEEQKQEDGSTAVLHGLIRRVCSHKTNPTSLWKNDAIGEGNTETHEESVPPVRYIHVKKKNTLKHPVPSIPQLVVDGAPVKDRRKGNSTPLWGFIQGVSLVRTFSNA